MKIESSTSSQLIIRAAGAIIGSNTGGILAYNVPDLELVLSNPRSRHIALHEHQTNVFKSIANMFWQFTSADIGTNPYAVFFGLTVDPLQSTITKLIKNIDGVGGVGTYTAYSGENSITVQSTESGLLEMEVNLEYFNVKDLDTFLYSYLLEMLASKNKKVMGNLKIKSELAVASKIAKDRFYPQSPSFNENNVRSLGPLCPYNQIPEFFGSLVAQFGSMITTESVEELNAESGNHWADIEALCNKYVVGYGDILYEYIALLFAQILATKGVPYSHHVTDRLQGDLLAAVTFSPERKFTLME